MRVATDACLLLGSILTPLVVGAVLGLQWAWERLRRSR